MQIDGFLPIMSIGFLWFSTQQIIKSFFNFLKTSISGSSDDAQISEIKD